MTLMFFSHTYFPHFDPLNISNFTYRQSVSLKVGEYSIWNNFNPIVLIDQDVLKTQTLGVLPNFLMKLDILRKHVNQIPQLHLAKLSVRLSVPQQHLGQSFRIRMKSKFKLAANLAHTIPFFVVLAHRQVQIVANLGVAAQPVDGLRPVHIFLFAFQRKRENEIALGRSLDLH